MTQPDDGTPENNALRLTRYARLCTLVREFTDEFGTDGEGETVLTEDEVWQLWDEGNLVLASTR